MGPALVPRRVVPSKSGDHLLTVNKSKLPVENVFETGDTETVYNFRVADWHTYFVGDNGWDFEVWVHNACGAGGQAPNRGNGGFSGRKGYWLKNHPSQPVRNSPATIGERTFSGHALDQMQNRGIPPSVVDNAIKHGEPFPGKNPGTQGFFDAINKVRVIINSDTGTVITVIPGGG